MGIGYALGEQMLFDRKTGAPLNNNFLDYKIPTSMDVPEIQALFVETQEPTGPFGNKGLAEPPFWHRRLRCAMPFSMPPAWRPMKFP